MDRGPRGRGGATRERTAGLLMAQFDHHTSRESDPQLHTHAFIFNLAPRRDGSWGARTARRVKTRRPAHRGRRRSQQAGLSMLRRSDDHHRGLRAWCRATVSANRSNDRQQARHLMTASQSRKSARRARCRSSGHGKVRFDTQPPTQIGRQLPAFNAICGSYMSHFPFGQPARPAQLQSHTSAAAFKSP